MISEEWLQLGSTGAMGLAMLYTIRLMFNSFIEFIQNHTELNNEARREDAKINAKAMKRLAKDSKLSALLVEDLTRELRESRNEREKKK
ncbi:MAG: hypothetical protein ACPGXY_03125 [Alphaproteobacteria bacterium]